MRVEGEELVSQADIAERTGRSRQAVNHWIKRDADSSGFPEPAYGTSTRSPLWRWGDVQSWLEPDADTRRSGTDHRLGQRNTAHSSQPQR